MQKMKVALYLVLALTLLVGMVGCGPAATEAPAEPPAEEAPTAVPPEATTAPPMEEAKPYEGVELSLASMTDQYVAAFRYLIPVFEEETGIKVVMDELGYVDLRTKTVADFVGDTAQYDLMTVDIVWSGEYGANGYTLALDDFMARDAEEMNLDDIMPVAWTLGEWEGKHYAFPLAGYANVLNYRADLLAEAGIEPPATQEELLAAAQALTKEDGSQYGIALLGAGSAGAQDFMAFVQQHGGTILDADGNVKVNTPENVAILEFFGSLFDYAPPGAADYWWDQRESAFRDGIVAMMEGWSIARAGYENPEISNIVGLVDITKAPVSEGMEPQYGFGGWGIGINADSDPVKQEAAWEFIKWVTSEEVQKEWLRHDGAPIRRSTLTDPELVAEYPWLPLMLESFEKGNGDYRPRFPQYSIVEDALGTYVNAFLTGQETAQDALDKAQTQIEANMP
ncbi:MAG: sugar ABC transporter substrate-binding protein [Anaerolineae bacterium]|nr:sugar ABC transporter substrate-binding protein [Anaerolineae bacterium]